MLNARKALYDELDIINIVKLLRLAQFTSRTQLKAHQALLVGWQDRYNIYGGEQKIPIDDYNGSSFTHEDAILISKLLANEPVSASEMKDANEKASRDFVQDFDTDTDEIDRLLFNQITDKESLNSNIQSYRINAEADEMLLS